MLSLTTQTFASTIQAQLALKASILYVDTALALKANQATTYTKTKVDGLLTPKATVACLDAQLLVKVNIAACYIIIISLHVLSSLIIEHIS